MKQTNKHFYQEKLNSITEYIHNNLDSKIDIKTLAELSCFSPFHFHRITRALLGEPIGKYITRTRQETAAKLLRYSKLKIEIIAYNVGFDTPSSFTKAFKSHFGISPNEYRKDKSFTIKTTNIMQTTLNIKAPKIQNIEDKTCLYLRMHGNYQTLDYTGAWTKLWEQVKAQKLFTKGIQHFGLPHDDPKVTDENKIRYDACLIIHKNAKPNGEVGVKTLSGGKFAVFLYQGSYKYFADVYDYIFNDWLLNSEYELRDEPVRERYISHPDRVTEEKLKTEFYIPVR
ncbi:AraC family transcriptional regulator [Hyunsoonleella pacifica]|uniref:AraC family transcriptional regulator n=1 Tax=Hyunsoonleella pacifica TaxID=1080224 RepID=A0A4Q9FRZ1_9FLAO|nr:AraC family transcriptional regulator [Hyunsoonleella pacifica]TBN18824.1 AraC family transcriptional regulator [Hyunsoonleella pacifica]GGD05078.1 AraC family transcriptional regulator [Hyunsoonleella pacifica]